MARQSIDEAVDVFVQVASTLAYAHSKGILHRDLKPANILISMQDNCPVKVVDFGMAKLIKKIRGESQITEEGTAEIIGAPYYMSPEQCHGETLDPSSDIYSLGL